MPNQLDLECNDDKTFPPTVMYKGLPYYKMRSHERMDDGDIELRRGGCFTTEPTMRAGGTVWGKPLGGDRRLYRLAPIRVVINGFTYERVNRKEENA